MTPWTLSIAALAALIVAPARAEQPYTASAIVAAPDETNAIPLYGVKEVGTTSSEVWTQRGREGLGVRNVTRPTLTPVLPLPGKATGAAVIVAPGGAFMALAMQHEGWAIAHALAARGISAFVLKYRLRPTPHDDSEAQAFMMRKVIESLQNGAQARSLQTPEASEDVLAAIALVRGNASRWRIDPARVGIIGFSAGAMTALHAVLTAAPGKGPQFLGYIYGPQRQVDVPEDAPPLFDAIAMNDDFFASTDFPIVGAWYAAKRPVELHAFQSGGHGFGLGAPGTTNALLLDEFCNWLGALGFLKTP